MITSSIGQQRRVPKKPAISAVFSIATLYEPVLNSFNLKAMGGADFDKYVFNLPIPKFDGNDPLHRELVRVARTAEEVAKAIPEKADEYFTRTRKRVRSVLTEHGVAAELELLAKRLLERPSDR